MQTAMLRTAITAPARHAGRRALSRAPVLTRAQAEGTEHSGVQVQKQGAEKQQGGAPARRRERGTGGGTSVAFPRSAMALAPSFGRFGSVFRDMEQEMAEMARAFGMPMPGFGLGADMPTDVAAAAPSGAVPLSVDVKDHGDRLELVADVPGMGAGDIKVSVDRNGVMTIAGSRAEEHRAEDAGVLRVERSFGEFRRAFRLPETADVDAITAAVKDGVLRLTVPKRDAPEPHGKTIAVQAE